MSELPPLSPEVLIPRLGDFLVEKKLITTEQLEIALLRQQEVRKKGKAPLLGDEGTQRREPSGYLCVPPWRGGADMRSSPPSKKKYAPYGWRLTSPSRR